MKSVWTWNCEALLGIKSEGNFDIIYFLTGTRLDESSAAALASDHPGVERQKQTGMIWQCLMRGHFSLSHWILAAYFEVLKCVGETDNKEHSQVKLTLSIQAVKCEELQYWKKILFFRSFYFKLLSLFILLITLANSLGFIFPFLLKLFWY